MNYITCLYCWDLLLKKSLINTHCLKKVTKPKEMLNIEVPVLLSVYKEIEKYFI